MNDERYAEADVEGKLTPEEIAEGWHFCCELDEALVNFKDVSEFCTCYDNITDEGHGGP